MKITWYGHSCFSLESGHETIVLDPFHPNMVPGLTLNEIKANRVFCSHEHEDHNHRASVLLKPLKTTVFDVSFLPTFHDDHHGERRGKNNITILSAEGIRVAHFGDLGCPLTKEQVDVLRGVDAVMIPVGGHYTIDAITAKAICDQIHPRIIIPMHYKGTNFGFPVLAGVEEFTKLFDSHQIYSHPTNQLELSPVMPKQVALLRCPIP